jgi:hypothetical protein
VPSQAIKRWPTLIVDLGIHSLLSPHILVKPYYKLLDKFSAAPDRFVSHVVNRHAARRECAAGVSMKAASASGLLIV